MRNRAGRAAFRIAGLAGTRRAEVLGEGRSVTVSDGRFEDAFAPYAVHLYAIAGRSR